MLVDFDLLPDDSRIWIYPASQKLTNFQENYILDYASNHLKDWLAHELALTSGITILESRFVVVALDENKNRASGCSIDILQNKIQEIEKALSISLMNRLNIFCIINDVITCIPVTKLGININQDTLFYDFTIQRKSEISSWLKPIKEGWCNKFLK